MTVWNSLVCCVQSEGSEASRPRDKAKFFLVILCFHLGIVNMSKNNKDT